MNPFILWYKTNSCLESVWWWKQLPYSFVVLLRSFWCFIVRLFSTKCWISHSLSLSFSFCFLVWFCFVSTIPTTKQLLLKWPHFIHWDIWILFRSQLGLLSFALAQICYALILIVGYFAYFAHRILIKRKYDTVVLKSLKQLFPQIRFPLNKWVTPLIYFLSFLDSYDVLLFWVVILLLTLSFFSFFDLFQLRFSSHFQRCL